MKKWLLGTMALTTLTFTACSNSEGQPQEKTKTTQKEQKAVDAQAFYQPLTKKNIEHLHGIGYPGNFPFPTFATHDGLRVYKEGTWLETKGQAHDYMGFQAGKDGFYTSGHPEKGSDLKNPLGLVTSKDGGQTLEKLAFYGEIDFHSFALGYNNHSMYVFNEEATGTLKQGLQYSTDEGKTWKPSKMTGLTAPASSFVAHPDKASVIAMATKQGVFLSTDYGNTFQLFSTPVDVTALIVSAEDVLYTYIANNKQTMVKQSFSTSATTDIPLPPITETIMYIAQHPTKPEEIVFATKSNTIYITTNSGKDWKKLTEKGTVQ